MMATLDHGATLLAVGRGRTAGFAGCSAVAGYRARKHGRASSTNMMERPIST